MEDQIARSASRTSSVRVRYPIPVAMRGTVTMPKHYQELFQMLEEKDQV